MTVYLKITTPTAMMVIRTTMMTTRIPMTAINGALGSWVDPTEPINSIIYLSDLIIKIMI